MAHVSVRRHHIVGNRSEEVVVEMVIGVGRRGRTVGGLGFSERGKIKA